MRKNSIYSACKRICAAIIAAVLAATLFACAAPISISFYASELVMYVGETRDIAYYAQLTPSYGAVVELEIDGECVEAYGTRVTAVAAGEATVTARTATDSATIKIKAEYRAANGVYLTTDGKTVQNVKAGDTPEPVAFTAATDDYADPDAQYVWTVNGSKVGEGRGFEFAPEAYGEYAVTVSCNGVARTETVRIYRETDARAYYDGALNQDGDFSAVRFFAVESADSRNPRSVFEWTVNGEVASRSQIFDFTPTAAGEYEIAVAVNGAARRFEGGDSVLVTATGVRAPDVFEVAFDDCDGVFVRWRDGMTARSVSVTDPSGVRRVYELTDARYAERFAGGEFDATGLIEVCADNAGVYKLRITADGRGDEFEFMQYDRTAEPYLTENVLCRNSFIPDAAQAEEWVRELYACGITRAECYVARGVENIEQAIIAAAQALGLTAETQTNGAVVSVAFGDYTNAPAVATPAPAITQIYSVLPHIEYDAAHRRNAAYVLPIDRIKKSVSVDNSEQLLCVALGGRRPAPESGSAAGRIYGVARRVLLSIIGADYAPSQKAHAIYDWLQWSTKKTNAAAADGSARYLEGLFGDGKPEDGDGIAPTGALDSLGMSKAFALLCRMEGIECDIERDADGYYNTVALDGITYVANVYGGESSGVVSTRRVELTSHAGIMLPYDGAIFDDGELYYLQKGFYDGEYYDYYIDAAERDDYETCRAAVFAAFSERARGGVTVPSVDGITTFEHGTLGAEFMLGGVVTDATVSGVSAMLRRAAVEYYEVFINKNVPDAVVDGIRVYREGNVLHITVTVPAGSGKIEGV